MRAINNAECRLCKTIDAHRPVQLHERMYGSLQEFNYFECTFCGTLQIYEIPDDMGVYYPSNYYSFSDDQSNGLSQSVGALRMKMRGIRTNYILHGRSLIGRALQAYSPDQINASIDWLRKANVQTDSTILDVGCGFGRILRLLREKGFTRLFGVDPYIPEEVKETCLSIEKKTIFESHGAYDLVMFNHSFEHMPNPKEIMAAANALCKPGGTVLIRTPVAACAAWRKYGEYWVQLDAPRHLFIPTESGIRALAAEFDLELRDTIYDSTELQFYGSEMYRKSLPLFQENGEKTISALAPFSTAEMDDFKRHSEFLNTIQQGDQAAFFLHRRTT